MITYAYLAFMETFNKYMEIINDGNRNIIKPTQEELNDLISYGEHNPDSYFIVAYFYLINQKYDEFNNYIKLSFEKGSKRGFNTFGYYIEVIQKDVNEAIKWYHRAVIENNSKTAMNNLVLYYDKINNIELRDKYLDMGIQEKNGKSCYLKANYCKKANNMEDYMKYMKLGAKYNCCDCMVNVLDYYKEKNFQKYLKYLKILATYDYASAKKTLSLIELRESANLDKYYSENAGKIDDVDLYSYYKKKNDVNKMNEIIKRQENEGSIGLFNQAMHYITENQIEEVLKIGDTLIEKNDIYGYMVMHFYYHDIKKDLDAAYEYLLIAQEIESDNFIVNLYMGLFHKNYKNDIETALTHFKKSYEKNYCIQNMTQLMILYREQENFVEFAKFFKLILRKFEHDTLTHEIDYIINNPNKELAIEIIKNNFLIGLITLIMHHANSNIKNICEQLESKIFCKQIMECPICLQDSNLNVILTCRCHKMCISCFEMMIKNKKMECPLCFYKFTEISRERML